MLFSICLGKKNAEVIEFLGILKKYASKNKNIFFAQERKVMFRLIKVIFAHHNIFNVDLSLFIQLAKVQQATDPDYVTGQINSRILELE